MKKGICGAVTALMLSALAAFSAMAADVSWSDLSLDVSGNASWTMNLNGQTEEVDKYQLQLARQKNGTWKESFKTVTTEDDSYAFSFSSTGKYKFKLRAKLVGGGYTNWSGFSNEVIVTRDDINGDDWDDDVDPFDDYLTEQNRYGNYGPGYTSNGTMLGTTVAAGPGYVGTTAGQTPTANVNYGWVKDANGWWYRHQDGSYPKNSWQHIDDQWYFFNNAGYMQTSWIFWNGSWYYALPEGPMAKGWNNINEKWYYFNDAGIMLTGYQVIDGKTYFLDASGARFQNGTAPDGHVFDANGVMIR